MDWWISWFFLAINWRISGGFSHSIVDEVCKFFFLQPTEQCCDFFSFKLTDYFWDFLQVMDWRISWFFSCDQLMNFRINFLVMDWQILRYFPWLINEFCCLFIPAVDWQHSWCNLNFAIFFRTQLQKFRVFFCFFFFTDRRIYGFFHNLLVKLDSWNMPMAYFCEPKIGMPSDL